MNSQSSRRRLLAGIAFLLPNIAGFCAFTLVPLVLSFGMAFTDWDFLRRNAYRHDPLHFVGWENFTRLFADSLFWRDLGNTLFLMLGLPFAIAGSLGAALLLARTDRRRGGVGLAIGLAALVFAGSIWILLSGGMAEQGVWVIFGILAAAMLIAGPLSGGSVYRTLFYLPHFTAGVATFVLWKKLYNPQTGPIDYGMAPVLDRAAAVVRSAPEIFSLGLPAAGCVAALLLAVWQARRLRRRWDDSDAGGAAILLGALALAAPLAPLLIWLGASRPWRRRGRRPRERRRWRRRSCAGRGPFDRAAPPDRAWALRRRWPWRSSPFSSCSRPGSRSGRPSRLWPELDSNHPTGWAPTAGPNPRS